MRRLPYICGTICLLAWAGNVQAVEPNDHPESEGPIVLNAADTCTQEKVTACVKAKQKKECDRLLGLVCTEAGHKLLTAGETERAGPYLVRACRLGVGATCTVLGEQRLGAGKRQEAMIFFTQACLSGHQEGCLQLKKLGKAKEASAKELNPVAAAWLETHMDVNTDISCEDLSHEECFAKAETYRRKGDVEPALALFNAGCARDYGAACNRLGWMLMKQGKAEEAATPLKKACRSGEAKACNNLGWLAEKSQRTADAARWYGKACDHGHEKACKRVVIFSETP